MNGKNLLIDMMAHLEWADAALWEAVFAREGAPDDDRLQFLLHHIHVVQRGFLLMWRGVEAAFPKLDSFDDAHAIATWGQQSLGELRAWLADATDDQLDGPLNVPWTAELEARLGRPVKDASIAQSIMQLAIHSAHHRGQAATRLSELGGTPPLNDFICWVWSDRPEAEWEGGKEGLR